MTFDGPNHVVITEKIPHSKVTIDLTKFCDSIIDVIFFIQNHLSNFIQAFLPCHVWSTYSKKNEPIF
jgi:hypothetical protein